MTPAPATLEWLRHLRFAPHHARPDLGPGERRSSRRGAGIEFLDHRPYRPGDDIRDLDHRLMARLGQPFLRQFTSEQRLAVSILLDVSPSMAVAPGRPALAADLAGLLGFVALTGGDALRLWRGGPRRAECSALMSGVQRADQLFGWLTRAAASQPMTFDALIRAALPELPPRGLVILISDWQDRAAVPRLADLVRAGHEPVVIRLAAPSETDPAWLGQGVFVLEDAETGDDVTIALNAETIAAYRRLWDARTDALSSAARAGRGWFFDPGSEMGAAGPILASMLSAGLLRARAG